jgi:hypothetical protein
MVASVSYIDIHVNFSRQDIHNTVGEVSGFVKKAGFEAFASMHFGELL